MAMTRVDAPSTASRDIARDRPFETHGLGKRYGETAALEDLTLSVAAGEVYGYLGPNGSGKTTTIRLLLGLHRPSAGRAELAARTDPFAHVGFVPAQSFRTGTLR